MSKILAILSFVYNHPASGLISVAEGETAEIDSAEAKRLESAGILQIVSANQRQPNIETANISAPDGETTIKRGKK